MSTDYSGDGDNGSVSGGGTDGDNNGWDNTGGN
jgi:hypothetical protein